VKLFPQFIYKWKKK